MKVLVTGANGQLGQYLMKLFAKDHEVVGYGRDGLDITDAHQTKTVILDENPDTIIHAAALTKVDYCAENPDEAIWVNGYGTQHVAYAAQAIDAKLVYVSSNEVFDGTNTGTYLEHDQTNPINPYGYSKWVGEQMVMQHVRKFYIARVSWLFGHGGRNFIHIMKNLAEAERDIRVVTNEVSTPTYVNDFADAIAQLIQTDYFGIYHIVNKGRASRWTFARHVLDTLGYKEKQIERISAAEYPRPSKPPEYAVLRNLAGANRGITLRDWREAVEAFLKEEGTI